MAELRCWPGCLAFIVHPGPWHGCMVEVLHAAPAVQFTLPDGVAHAGCRPGFWVVRSLGRPFSCPRQIGDVIVRASGMHGVCGDHQLRPITPPPATKTTDTPAEMETS